MKKILQYIRKRINFIIHKEYLQIFKSHHRKIIKELNISPKNMKINKCIKQFNLTNNHKNVNDKIFVAIIIGMLLIWLCFSAWNGIFKSSFQKNTGGSGQAVFPERKVECIKSLNRPGPLTQNDSSRQLFSGNN